MGSLSELPNAARLCRSGGGYALNRTRPAYQRSAPYGPTFSDAYSTSQSTFNKDVTRHMKTVAQGLGISDLRIVPHSFRKMSCKTVRWLMRMYPELQIDDVLIDAHYQWKDKESKSTMRIRYAGSWPRLDHLLVTDYLVRVRRRPGMRGVPTPHANSSWVRRGGCRSEEH